MLLEKLLKGANFSINIFNLEESKLFDQYFERILISKDTLLIKEGEIERYSYFVFDGMLRFWLLNHKGEKQIFWFCKEPRLFVAPVCNAAAAAHKSLLELPPTP